MPTPSKDLLKIPEGLPVPKDDGACDHLQNAVLSDIILESTGNRLVDLKKLSQNPVVLFFYPRTGVPDEPIPEGWDLIPGARGCTPQSCGYNDLLNEFKSLGVEVFGVSSQTTAFQKEFVSRMRINFEILSDCKFELTKHLRLPTFEYAGDELIRRMALYLHQGVIKKVFYPVFPPDQNARVVLNWLRKTNK